MPKKSRRVAVRQAELGQRKRRSNRAGAQAQGPEAQVSAPIVQSTEPTAATSEAPAVPQAAAVPETPRNVPQPAHTPATAARAAAPYMWPELRRIGVLTGLMLVILAVLTAVLR
jgi:hypothetical protein